MNIRAAGNNAALRRSSYQPFVVMALALTGCAGYHRRPLVPRDVLRDLQEIRLEALRPATAPSVTASPGGFDATDGLSSDEAVAVSLVLNPDVRAFRKERGVAEGEVTSAELLPNPELEVTWVKIEDFTKSFATGGLDAGVSWSPPRPGERRALKARAENRLEQVKAQIADKEWRIATDVRKAYAGLLAANEKLRLADVALKLQDRILRFVGDKRDLGDASSLDVNLAEIEHADAQREREAIAIEHDKAELDLLRLLGLPPSYAIELQAPADALAYRPFALDVTALEALMIDRRPDLLAASQEYEQAEQDLHIAYIQRWPWFSFGPRYERDGSQGEGLVKKWGIGILGLTIPILNFNQGEIQKIEARRDQLREEFTASVHAARAELHEAFKALQAQERLLNLYEQSMKPALAENERLTEAGLEMRDLDLLQLVTTQDKVLKGRRDFVDAELAYWEAAYDMETALGARLADGRESSPPDTPEGRSVEDKRE